MACEPLAGTFCMLAFFTPARLMLKVACPGAFAWKVMRKHRSIAADAGGSRRTRSRELQNAHHAVIAIHQRDRLAVLRQQRSVGDVQHLQHARVVEDLHRNRGDILPARQVHVHGEGGTHRLVQHGRIEADDRTARRAPMRWKAACRCWRRARRPAAAAD